MALVDKCFEPDPAALQKVLDLVPYYYSWTMLFSEATATHPIACGGHYRRIGCRVAVAVALQEQDDALEVQSIASGNTTMNGILVGEFSAKGHGFRVLDHHTGHIRWSIRVSC
eukprot:COSAG05_NODE_2266_length_3307_cov_2.517768_3_plen_113_part_00